MVVNVWWVPTIALAVAVFAEFAMRGGRFTAAPTRRPAADGVRIALFTGIALFYAIRATTAAGDARAFRADDSCIAPLDSIRSSATAACSVVAGRIVDHEITHYRSSTVYSLDVDVGAGRVLPATLSSPDRAFWQAVEAGNDPTAFVRLFRGGIVEIETSAGRERTRNDPRVQTSSDYLFAVVFLAMATVSVLFLAFRRN